MLNSHRNNFYTLLMAQVSFGNYAFIYLLIYHWYSFQFAAIVNSAAVNICVQDLYKYDFVS